MNIIKKITSYEDACNELNLDPKNLPIVDSLPPKDRKSIIGNGCSPIVMGLFARIRPIYLRMHVCIPDHGSAFQQANARNNSESNLSTCGMTSYCLDKFICNTKPLKYKK